MTGLSFLIFSFHYLLNVNIEDYINAITSRFKYRSFSNPITIKFLFSGYYNSYKTILSIIVLSLITSFIFIHNSLKYYFLSFKKYSILLFLLFVPILENFIMKEHAISYTFDRLKVSLFLITVLLIIIIRIYKKNKKLFFILFYFIFVIQFFNLLFYQNDNKYSYSINYNYNNITISEYIKNNFNDIVWLYNLSDENWTKGVLNSDNKTLLFLNNPNNQILLNKNIYLTINKNKYLIDEISIHDSYIHVKLNENMDINSIQELEPIIISKF